MLGALYHLRRWITLDRNAIVPLWGPKSWITSDKPAKCRPWVKFTLFRRNIDTKFGINVYQYRQGNKKVLKVKYVPNISHYYANIYQNCRTPLHNTCSNPRLIPFANLTTSRLHLSSSRLIINFLNKTFLAFFFSKPKPKNPLTFSGHAINYNRICFV